MRYLPVFLRLALISLFLCTGALLTFANDPVAEAQKAAKEAQAQEAKAKEAKAKLDCDKPKTADKNALVKAVKAARAAAENAQKWADQAKADAEKAGIVADANPKNEKAKEAKEKADKGASDAQKAADDAKKAYDNALDEAPGMKAAADIEKELDKADVKNSSKKKEIVDKLKKAAQAAAEANPCDPEEVKRVVRVKLEKAKKEVKGNSELRPWVEDLGKTLKDNALIFFQPPGQDNLVFTATGTGRTTGHIADLVIFNPGDQAVTLTMPAMYIPSSGQYQPYIVPSVRPITVQPYSTANISLQGYCANIFTKPVPAGESFPPLSNWITVDYPSATAQLPSGFVPLPTQMVPSPGSDWRPNSAQGWQTARPNGTSATATFPGTDTPLGHTIDLLKYPTAAAPILLDMLNRISQTFDQQQSVGLISTPFSGNPQRERETVIQQTLWLSAAALTGQEYKLEDFRNNTIEQMEQSSGKPFAKLPQAEKEQLNQGVSAFWNTFEGVGAKAKVLGK